MRWSLALALLAGVAVADDSSTTDSTSSTSIALSDGTTVTNPSSVSMPTGSYEVYSTTITLADGDRLTSTFASNASATATGNSTGVLTTTTNSVTVLVGGAGGGTTTLGNSSMNATATSTSTSATATNTSPCNSYPEYCGRKYSNITMVAAHNSPFVRKGNAAANQDFTVKYQLDDGIRMLQFQVHNQNGTLMLCHTSCSILNVGTLEAYLTTVTEWVRTHPLDVVTILMGNYDYVSPTLFVDPVKSSGLLDYVYTPNKAPMTLDDWPTLSELIYLNKRVIVFMDYQANQTEVGWLQDEFSQIWETPFSPTNADFPCTQQRPPGISEAQAKDRMYMANHNLNVDLNLGAIDLLIPNTAILNETNAVNGSGSLGDMARRCTKQWDRPPNFLLVDFYNDGNFNGSVFQVAAEMNNVSYNHQACCGTESAAVHGMNAASLSSIILVVAAVHILLSAF